MSHLKKIQDYAGRLFPAQELWYNTKLGSFWAFEKDGKKVTITLGNIQENNGNELTFNTSEYYSDDIDTFVDALVNKKIEEGFECFAIELCGD